MSDKRRLILIPVALVVGLVILWLTVLGRSTGADAVTSSGTVEATEADLGFQAPGRIEHIGVREGDTAAAGAELARLDRAELTARKQAADALVTAARARLRELETGFRTEEIAQGRAAVRAATRRQEETNRDLERVRTLFAGGAVSRQQLDRAETAFELARADRETAQERLDMLESGPRTEQIAAQRALLAQAQATVAQVDAALRQAVIRAPVAGVIAIRHREPGEIVPAGAPVITLRNPDDRWVRIFVAEDRVGRLFIGQRATITADAYPDRSYDGEVVFIAGDAEFTPRNVQTTAERVKLVYRVKIRITADPSHDLKPGLPADVRLEVPVRG